MNRLRTVAAAVCLLTVAGCSDQVAYSADPAQVRDAWSGCLALASESGPGEQLDLDGTGSVPDDFQTTTVVQCIQDDRRNADRSIDRVIIEQRAASDEPLLDALRLPSLRARRLETVTCPAIGYVDPWLFLMDADGRWMYPEIPREMCGEPREAFTRAHDALAFRTHATEVLSTVRTAAAAEAGCDQQVADMPWYYTTVETPSPAPAGVDPFDGAGIRLCRYVLPPGQSGVEKGVGDFVSGGRVHAAQRSRLAAAIVGSTDPADPCTTPATGFARLTGVEPQDREAYVELDGCRRLVIVDPAVSSAVMVEASAELVRLLTA